MGVIGHKVALGDAKGRIALLNRQFHKLDHSNFPPFFLKLQKKENRFSDPGEKRSAGYLKNAFFDYTPQVPELQVNSRQRTSKNYLPNLGMLRKRSCFSWRRNWWPMMRQIFPVRIIQ